MKKNALILAAVFMMAFSLSTTTLLAQGNNSPAGNGNQKKNSPFLITGKLPHLTKLLMQQWDNPELNLSEEQKSKLLVVRKETIGAVQQLGPKVTALEKEVVDGIFAGKTPAELQPLVQTIADLKVKATMVHLRCIYDTKKNLNEQQLKFLKN